MNQPKCNCPEAILSNPRINYSTIPAWLFRSGVTGCEKDFQPDKRLLLAMLQNKLRVRDLVEAVVSLTESVQPQRTDTLTTVQRVCFQYAMEENLPKETRGNLEQVSQLE